MSSTTTDQVTIDVDNELLDANKQQGSTTHMDLIAVDGRRHNRHGSNGSHHHSHQSGNHSGAESDADDRNGHKSRRSRRRSRSRSKSPSHRSKRATETGTPPTEKDVVNISRDVEPLLVTDVNHKKHTELDENSDDSVTQHEQNPGVDDGFFVGTNAEPEDTDDNKHNHNHHDHNNHDYNPSFPYAPGYAPGYNPNVMMDASGNPQIIPDINVYQQKKNLAQGMMDLALLSANANQLRYVVETYSRHPYYWFSMISICISLILQVAVGVGLILNSRYNVKNMEQICRADKINNLTVIGIFLITATNVFITAFGVAPESETGSN